MILSDIEKDFLSDYFGIHECDDNYELEQWTDGGVDMIIYLDKNTEEPFVRQFENYIDNFDVDEEIDLYREGKDYRNAFSIRESVSDFETWEKWCNQILERWKFYYKINRIMSEANIPMINKEDFNKFLDSNDYKCVATIDNNKIIVCDNKSGDKWTEEFNISDYHYARDWAIRKIEISDYYEVLKDRKKEINLETEEELSI